MFGLSFEVATHWGFMGGLFVVVWTRLAACFRVMFGADQVSMCMAVTATISLFPAAAAVAGSGGGTVSHRFDKFFNFPYPSL